MLKPLDRYGRWLEQIGRYTTARLLYARALTIAEQAGGRGSVARVSIRCWASRAATGSNS